MLCFLLLAPQAGAQSSVDIDGDGLLDREEDINGNGAVDSGETDWRNADTDDGGEADGSEIKAGRSAFNKTDDLTFDQDNDGLNNGSELLKNTDPKSPDTDGDGILDGVDPFPLEKAFHRDADEDGIADEWEEQNKLSAESKNDADNDDDEDGLTNAQEFVEGTNPQRADTDFDGVEDGEEVTKDTDPEESACLHFGRESRALADLEGHWTKPFVDILSRTLILPTMEPIVKGYAQDDGEFLFLPDRLISRFELLKIALFSSCIKLELDLAAETSNDFSDVPRMSRPRESEDRAFIRKVVYTAAAVNIVRGYSDGTFRPDQPVTRAEALKMLLLASRLELPTDPVEIPFSDVTDETWSKQFIEQALYHDLVEGYEEDNTFRPDNPITRAEAAKIVHHIMVSNPNVNGYVIPHD